MDAAPNVLAIGFIPSFLSSFSMILVSEIGDKTFFIAAILAMRNKRSTGALIAPPCIALSLSLLIIL